MRLGITIQLIADEIQQILAADDLEIYYRESQNRESDLLVEEFVWQSGLIRYGGGASDFDPTDYGDLSD